MKYSMVLLLGPGQVETNRAYDLLESIHRYEVTAKQDLHFIVVNDGNQDLDQLKPLLDKFARSDIIPNPLHGVSDILYDRLAAGVFSGIRFAVSKGLPDFVMKIDTDAICISPFANRICEYFKTNPSVGFAGTYLEWPDGESRIGDFIRDWEKPTHNVYRKTFLKNFLIAIYEKNYKVIARHFKRKKLFRAALANGYKYGYHVQGGASAISRAALEIWAKNKTIDDPLLFSRSCLGDDIIFSLLAAATGLQLADFNKDGDVFGIWFRQPTYPVSQLKTRGYALLHSIKCKNMEDEIKLRTAIKNL